MDDVLERGTAHFFMRPGRRFFIVLHPAGRRTYRRLVIGKKHIPRADRAWMFVHRVAWSMDELDDTRGRAQEIARGTYRIRTHDDHVHFDYELDDPPLLDDVGLAASASYVATVMNPLARWGPRTRQLELPLEDMDAPGPREPSIYDDELQEKFEDKKYAPLDPAFLDHEGCEIVLIGHEPRIAKTHGSPPERPQAAVLRSGRRRAGA